MRLYLSMLFFVAFTTSSFAQLSSGQVANWTFSGNINDVSGNNLNGTATNITYVPGKLGVANTAAKFNGTNSLIAIPYNAKMNVDSYSICAVVKFDDFYNGACQHSMILQRGSFLASGSYSLSIFENAYDNGNCNKYDSTKMVFHNKTRNLETGITLDSFKHSPNVNKNQWYCVVSTFDGSRTRVYIDGTQVLSYSSTKKISSSTEGLSIGANNFSNKAQYPYWMNGIIDDLILYDRPLSPSEVDSFSKRYDTTITITSLTSKSLCINDTFHINYTAVRALNTGNTFVAELSDANGNFANPVIVGSLIGTSGGTINCTVPTNIGQGTGYQVRVRSNNPVRYSDDNTAINIFPTLNPTISITATPTGQVNVGQYITFRATAIDAGTTPTYQWKRNGQDITGAIADSLYSNTLNDGDSISVVVLSSNPCPSNLTAQSNTIIAKINTSVNDLRLSNLSLHPNPNKGQFIIIADNVNYRKVSIDVVNATGQIVYKQTVDVRGNKLDVKVNLSNHAQGMYLLRLSADGMQRNIRFIKGE